MHAKQPGFWVFLHDPSKGWMNTKIATPHGDSTHTTGIAQRKINRSPPF